MFSWNYYVLYIVGFPKIYDLIHLFSQTNLEFEFSEIFFVQLEGGSLWLIRLEQKVSKNLRFSQVLIINSFFLLLLFYKLLLIIYFFTIMADYNNDALLNTTIQYKGKIFEHYVKNNILGILFVDLTY